jgi:hypothetical protein
MNQEQIRHIIKFDRKVVELLEKKILQELTESSLTDASIDSTENRKSEIRAEEKEQEVSSYLFERRQHLREILQYEKLLPETLP